MALAFPRPLAVMTVAALVLAGCSSGKKAADPNAPVTITWWTGQAEDAEKLLEALAADYQKAHPNVTIKVSAGAPTTDELLTKLSAAFVSGTHPDISYAYGSWATQLAQSGRTQDISSEVADPKLGWQEFPAAARATATVDGKVIGLPAVVDNLGIIYNKKLFDQAKLAYPTDDWTWDDFRAAAKKLTNHATNVYGTAYPVSGSENTTWMLWPLLWQHGGAILSKDSKTPQFNSDAGVQALTFLRDMAVTDKSMYLDQTDEKFGPLFLDGRVGMLITGPWQMYDIKQRKLDYGVAFLPGVNGDHQTISGPDLWTLYDHDDPNRAKAARDFVIWLTGKDTDGRNSLVNGNLPLRDSEKTTQAYQKFVKDFPGAQKFVENLANAKQPRPTVPGYVELSQYVGDAVSQVLQGAADPKAALDTAAKKSTEALAQ
ncbi:ABC transporter substrate-binding protein [Nonomuraea sediminis]|uniref:ABC transporter substrate-binding protein n=1 Tax=Nonomuraea sediminis TaxID=2835864 RepID=UPI001BDDB152|nr:ABC transporter substrate-binding protein [Nonomuraea sediminis]